MFYWILGQDTGISNESAILDNKSYSIAEISASELNGAIFTNGSFLLSPENILIDNGNFIVPYLYFPFTYLFEIDISIASILIILVAVKIKRKYF